MKPNQQFSGLVCRLFCGCCQAKQGRRTLARAIRSRYGLHLRITHRRAYYPASAWSNGFSATSSKSSLVEPKVQSLVSVACLEDRMGKQAFGTNHRMLLECSKCRSINELFPFSDDFMSLCRKPKATKLILNEATNCAEISHHRMLTTWYPDTFEWFA